MQDVFGWFGKKARKNRYKYSKSITWLRVTMLVVMVAALLAGAAAIVALLAPYSAELFRSCVGVVQQSACHMGREPRQL